MPRTKETIRFRFYHIGPRTAMDGLAKICTYQRGRVGFDEMTTGGMSLPRRRRRGGDGGRPPASSGPRRFLRGSNDRPRRRHSSMGRKAPLHFVRGPRVRPLNLESNTGRDQMIFCCSFFSPERVGRKGRPAIGGLDTENSLPTWFCESSARILP